MPAIRTTPTVRLLLIANVALFLVRLAVDALFGGHLLEAFALVPYQFFYKGHVWQLFTYMFMHADLFHILFNMLILWMIGSELEAHWGRRFFTTYYLICGLSGGVFYLAVQAFLMGSPANMVPMVGSSGAIYGLLVAYGIIYAERTLLFMMIFPMKAKHFVLVLAAIEFVSTVFYSRSGVANAAHLGGMIVGFLYLLLTAWLRVRKKQGPRRPKQLRKHLKLVVNKPDADREFDADHEADETDGPQRPTFH